MANNNKYTVGLLVANITDPFSNSVAKGAMHAAEDFDVNLVIVPGKYMDMDYGTMQDMQFEYQYNALFSHVGAHNLDYLVVCIGTIAYLSSSERKLEILQQFGDTPLLTVADKFEGYDYLVFDNATGVSEAVEFLINKSKCKRIAMMAGDLNNYECLERFNAYRQTLEANGYEYDESIVATSDVSENCYDEAKALLDGNPDIDAVVCANDAVANTVYKVAKEKGLRIGREICIVGFDDQPSSAKLDPPLASIKADAGMLGYKSIEAAFHRLNGKEDGIVNKVPTSFVPRASCIEDINSILYAYNLFSGTPENIAGNIMNYIYDKPVSVSLYKHGYEFIKKLMQELLDMFVNSDADESCMRYVMDTLDDLLRDDIDLIDSIEQVFTMTDFCYKWISAQIRENNLEILRKTFDYVYKRLASHFITTYKCIDDDRTEHIHLTNLVVRDTLMLENSIKNNYAYILRKLAYIGVNTSYLYLFSEPMVYRKGTFFPRKADWRFKAYQYGFDTFTVDECEQELTGEQLFNNERIPDNRRYTLVMVDLYSNEYQFGIVLCEPRDCNFFADVEIVTYQLSAAVKIIGLLKNQDQMLTELHTKNQALENMSMMDELTGIYNRRGFYSEANRLIQDEKYKDKELIITYADMDNLKMVNDAYGHIEGDFSLKALAQCLTSIFGDVFIAGRVGGDEYVVVAVKAFSGDIDTIRCKKEVYIEQLNKTAQKPYRINMSMGMYECKCQNSYDLSDAINKADDLLYQQKQKRKKEI